MVNVIIGVAVEIEVKNNVVVVNGNPVFRFESVADANIAASNLVVALDTRAQCERR